MKHFKALMSVSKLVKVQHKLKVGDLVEMFDGHDSCGHAKITKVAGAQVTFQGIDETGEGYIGIGPNGNNLGMYKTERWGSHVSHIEVVDSPDDEVNKDVFYDKIKGAYYYSTYEYQETEEVRNVEAGHWIKVIDYQNSQIELKVDAVVYTEKYAMIVAHNDHGMLYSATLNVHQHNDKLVILYTPTHCHSALTDIEFR